MSGYPSDSEVDGEVIICAPECYDSNHYSEKPKYPIRDALRRMEPIQIIAREDTWANGDKVTSTFLKIGGKILLVRM